MPGRTHFVSVTQVTGTPEVTEIFSGSVVRTVQFSFRSGRFFFIHQMVGFTIKLRFLMILVAICR